MWKYDGFNPNLVIMSEKKPKRLGKLAAKVGGAGKSAVKKKATDAVKSAAKTAAKPVTDAVSAKASEITQKATNAIEEKATEMVKKQMKKEVKKKFLGK